MKSTITVHLTPKALRLQDLVESGKPWDDALDIVDREFTEDGISLREEAAEARKAEAMASLR